MLIVDWELKLAYIHTREQLDIKLLVLLISFPNYNKFYEEQGRFPYDSGGTTTTVDNSRLAQDDTGARRYLHSRSSHVLPCTSSICHWEPSTPPP